MGEGEKSLAELLGDMKHVCIVIDDIEEAVKNFSKIGYQFGDIHIRARSPNTNPTILRGTPISYTLKAAVSRNTKPAIELTEVVEGTPTQQELFDKRGVHIHHLCYHVPNLEVAITKFKELGIDAIQRPVGGRLRWAMMDTVDLCGSYIEISEASS